MPRQIFSSLAILVLAVSLIALPTYAADQPIEQPASLTLTILHDNDLHGHILSFAYTETAISPAEMPVVGGAARRATLIKQIRSTLHNPSILIDSGDISTRDAFETTYEGIADVEAMNAVGYELAAIGNNEFKNRDGVDASDAAGAQAALLQVIARSRFPWICANATDSKGAFLTGVAPYVVRSFDGVRVGFLGLTAPRSATYPQTKGWNITDPIAAAKYWIREARKHCDILIAVTHLGVTYGDELLAAQTDGLDAIVGGDSHTYLYKADEIANLDGVKIPIVQDGEFGVRLGRFDLHLASDANHKWHIASYDYKLILVSGDLKEDPGVKAAIDPYVKPFETVVGHLKSIEPTPPLRTTQSSYVVAHAMLIAASADVALESAGDGLFDVFRHEAVTRFDVFQALPFHDDVDFITMSGARLTELEKRNTTITVSMVGPIDPAKTYKVAMIDYIATGLSGIRPEDIRDTGIDLRDAVIGYIRDNSGKISR